ncbi:hypothetical protein K1719_039038 [Acacia pycnantha]|nr:hypothetical protein K1719_039038 [Acacia pycnantha]
MKQDGDKKFSLDILDELAKKAEAWHRDSIARAKYAKLEMPITCATFAQDVVEGRANVSQAHDHKHQPLIFGFASFMNENLTSEREIMAVRVSSQCFLSRPSPSAWLVPLFCNVPCLYLLIKSGFDLSKAQ